MEVLIDRAYPSAVNMGMTFNGSALVMPCGMVSSIERLHLTVLVNDSIVMNMTDVIPRTQISFTNVKRVMVMKDKLGVYHTFITRFY